VAHHLFRLTLTADNGEPDGAERPKRRARRHTISAPGKPDISGSSAPTFHGESERWNPEELFLAALTQCHFLSYLYVAERAGMSVLGYECEAQATLEVDEAGAGRIAAVELFPQVQVDLGQGVLASSLHAQAHELCFIARSVSCEVTWRDQAIEVSPPDTQV
jgi:organic hydroperoxide reductase OsmC/OhrA